MRVEDSTHAEHVKVLDALSSNLKAEVSRGLKLLDSCVSQIAQAKWILTNVDESLSGFSKGCPVCGILPEKEKQLIKVSGGKEIKDKTVPTTSIIPAKRSLELTPTKSRIQPVAVERKKSLSPAPKSKSSSQPVHRIGPRSKTRPNEPIATTSAASPMASTPVEDFHGLKPTGGDNNAMLPKKLSIVVSQTEPQVQLTDLKPYLRGRATKVDLNNLNGFVSPKLEIPSELKFKPQLIKVESYKTKQPGPASRKFFESLGKSSTKGITPAVVGVDSSSSDDDKPSKAKAAPKKKGSDSGSDYDYNFATASTTTTTTSTVKKKSKIGSLVTLSSKRPRPLSTDSDEDYDIHKKKKGPKSIFKKKMSTSCDSDSDSDDYGRRKKKKIRRKDSTDKEKEKHHSGSKSHGSKTSSVVSSRMTITLGPSKASNSTESKAGPVRRDSSASHGGGSTTGSLVKSESGKRNAVASTTKPPPQHPPVLPAKTGYRPGPASRKIKPIEAPPGSSSSLPEPKPKFLETAAGESGKQGIGEANIDILRKPEIKQKGAVTNGTSESAAAPPTKLDPFTLLLKQKQQQSKEGPGNSSSQAPPSEKPNPFAMLKQKLKENVEAPPRDKPALKPVTTGGGGMSSLISQFDPQTKAKLAAKLALLSAQNKLPAAGKMIPAPLNLPTPSSAAAVQPVPGPTKSNDVEEEKEIELGDDIIGKCIGDLGDEVGPAASPAPPTVTDLPFTLSPMPPPTLQDCVSPTAMNKFFSPPEPDSPSTATVEKIFKLLLKLTNEPFNDEALLHSRDKLNELFGPGVTPDGDEMETYRGDLQEGSWYVLKAKTLGKAVCADTISVFEFEKVSSDELERILRELETYTASCIR